MSFLQGNLALVIGVFGLLVTLLLPGPWPATETFRRDVGGAIGWFVLFLRAAAGRPVAAGR